MRKVLLFAVAVMMTFFVSAQTIVFQENFESSTIGLTTTADSLGYPVSNFQAWAASTNLYKSGVKADSNVLQSGRTIYLTTSSFSTIGNSNVVFEFSQICKLYFADGGSIEISVDGGSTWTALSQTQYLGSGSLIQNGGVYKFSESAYSTWLSGDTLTKPTNAWWKDEKFDISSIAANQASVMLRFKYTYSGNPSGSGRYGWLLDDIKVTAAISELAPPTITMIAYPIDTVYSGGPYLVSAYVKDASGMDTVYISYKVGNAAFIQLGMQKSPTIDSLYTAGIPYVGYGRTITYNITARDASASHNQAYRPTTGYYSFYTKFLAAVPVIVGTGTSTANYPFKANADYTKCASLFLASEINKFGLINQLQWYVSTAQAAVYIPSKIYIKQTTATAMTADSWANLIAGAVLVYDATLTFPTVGWSVINLNTIFNYNAGNLLVLCEANNGTAATATPSFRYTASPTGTHQRYASSTATTGTVNTNRPNITIGFVNLPIPTPDAGISQIVNPAGSVVAGTSFPVNVKIKNFTIDSLYKANIIYSVDGNLPVSALWTGGLLKDSTSVFMAANLNLAVGAHTLKVWTDFPNDSVDQNVANDTAFSSFFACIGPLSGTYTVGGASANFLNLNDALVGITQCGINGPVTFNINPGIYSEQISIPEIIGASDVNTITFKSATNDSTSVIMNHTSTAAANWIVKLNGADYITFKNIKFAPADPVNAAAIVMTAGATNNKIIGSFFVGAVGTTATQYLLSIEGTSPANSNNLIQSNYFQNASYAIAVKGLSATKLKNILIRNNFIENSVVYGIYAQYVDSTMIDSNTVISSNTATNKYGIYLQNGNILNTITKNTVKLSGGTNMYGILAETSVSTDTTKGIIANNFVSLTNGATIAYGIRLNTVTKFKVYANSVVANSTGTSDARAMHIVTTSSGIDLKNNNLQSSKYPIYAEGASVTSSNYNNYFSTGTSFAYWNATNYANLTTLRLASLKDSNTIAVNPFFNSSNDLHTFNGLLKGMGTYLADVTTDIDGAPRLNPPCIGADEFLPPANDATLISILNLVGGCGLTSTENVKVVIKNVGTDVILPNTMMARYKKDSLNTPTSELVNRTINPGDTIQFVFATIVDLGVSPVTFADTLYKLKAWTDLAGDFAHANDTSSTLSLISMYTPPAPILTNATTVYGTSVILNAVSNRPISWFHTPSSSTVLYTGSSYTTPVLFASDTFYVESKTSSSISATVGTGTSSQSYPFYCLWGYTRSASIYQSSEIGGFGLINQLQWNVLTSASTAMPIKIYLKQTTLTSMTADTWANLISGATLVYDGTKTFNATGWSAVNLSTLFNYLSGNLMVLCEANYGGTGTATYPYFAYSTTTNNQHQYNYADSSPPTTTGYVSTSRPNIKISGSVAGCVGPRVPIIATVTFPASEAGISSIVAPTGCALYQVPITIKIFNHGSTALNSTNTTVTYKLDNGSYITPEVINIVVPAYDTLQYTFTTLANFAAPVTDRYIKVTAKVTTLADALPSNDILIKDSVLSRLTPLPPTTNNISIYNGNTATLTASGSVGSINWFNDLTGGTSIGQGSPFTTPFFLYATDTFYVEANTNYTANATVGTDVIQNTTLTYPSPYGQYYTGSKEQYLITKAELNALGIQAGVISSLGFDVVSAPGAALINYTLKIGHTNLAALTTTFVTGLTQVYANASLMPTTGWNIYNFTASFVWNGIDNIVIENCYDNYAGASSYTTNGIVNQTTTSFISTTNYRSDGGSVCPTTTATYTFTQRPNIKLQGMVPGCISSPRTPAIVNVGPPPMNDAGITTLVNPNGATPSGVSTPIKVKIKNFGQAHLYSAGVAWTLNGVAKPLYNFTGNIPSGLDTTITIANETFSGGLYCIKAWTQHPNGVAVDTTASNDTLFSTCFTACLNGNYTIGDTTGGSFHNFPTFTAAVNTLKIAGVCGSVIFLVDNGTYNEQLRISEIPGASAVNTITFRSASGDSTTVVLQNTASLSTESYTLLLDSADYIRIEKMTLKALGATYGYVVELRNGATNNIISNNSLEMPVTTSYTIAGIYDYSTPNYYNKYQNNKIINGYYGIYTYGSSTAALKKGTEIIGNKILNFYYYGIYSYYQDSIKIIGNEVNSNSTNTYIYAVYLNYNNNASQIAKNKIILTTPGSQYALYMYYCSGTAASRGLIANNMISLSGGSSSSSNYGIYPYYCDYQNFYYNSVNLAVPSTTYGYALYHYYGTQQNLLNNNFVNTGGGYAYYVSSATAIVLSNYNNIYTNGSVLAYWTANRNTLAALKTASGKDANSVSVNPMYTSVTDLHLLSTILSTLATPVAGITDDIDGFTRDAVHPTIGADEVPLLPHDAGVTIISRPVAVETEATAVPVKLTIKNFGTDSICTVTVSYVLNNATAVDFVYTPIVPIASLATDTVTFPVNMIVPAGNNTICAYTTLAGDSNTFNNQICKNFFGTPLYDARLSLAYPITEGCNLTMDTVKIMIVNQGINPISGSITASYQTLGGAAIVTDTIYATIAVGGSYLYKFTTLVNLAVTTADSMYHVKTWVSLVNDNISNNNSDTIDVKSMHTPVDPVTSNVTIPYATAASLVATSATNDPFKWYGLPSGGTALYTGSPYVTPILYLTDTFYVQSSTSSSFNATIGNGATNQTYPFYCYWGYTRSAAVYQASEIGGFGLMNQIKWDVATSASTNIPIKIYLKQITGNNMTADTWANLTNGATLVYSGTQSFNNAGWFAIGLSTAFNYLSGNLMVLTEANYGGTGTSPYPYFNYTTTTTNNTFQSLYQDSSPPTGTGTLSNTRPNIKLSGSIAGCSSQRVPAIVTVGAQSAIDVGVVSITAPVTAVNLTASDSVKVVVKNYGFTDISNFLVRCKLNNNVVVSQMMLDTIAVAASKSFTFTQTVNLSSNMQPDTFNIMAWTDLVGDPAHQNDTAKKAVINLPPVYCISSATYTGDDDLGQVVFAGINHGNSLPILNNPAATGMYNDYTSITPASVQPGSSYPISVSIFYSGAYPYSGYMNAFIDYNRNGTFELPGELVFGGAYDGTTITTLLGNVSVPYTALPGLTRMRIVAQEFGTASTVLPCGTYSWGETEDYTVAIIPPIPHDGGISRMNAMGSFVPYTASNLQTPQFYIRNYGSDSLLSANMNYVLNGGSPIVYSWNGHLLSLAEDSLIQNLTLQPGLNTIKAYTSGILGDINYLNDTLHAKVFKEYSTSPPYLDDFETNKYWFATDTASGLTINNLWAQGVPASLSLSAAHSPVNAWVTDLAASYTPSNLSVLYSPVFDISVMQADTLKFWQWRQFDAATYGYIEYLNSSGAWQTLGVQNDTNASNWYNTATNSWTGVNTNWTLSKYCVKNLSNLGNILQFRFTFISGATVSTMKGWAIDDFELSLAPIPQDGGVIAIISPTLTSLVGDIVTVSVTVKNFGTDILTNIPVRYQIAGGAVQMGTLAGPLAPGATGNFTFTQTFQVGILAYSICAYTEVVGDIYVQNNFNCKNVIVNSALNDVGITQILQPAAIVNQGTTPIKVEIKNFGTLTQTNIPLSYQRGLLPPVDGIWTGSLAAGATAEFTFPNPMTIPSGLSFSLCAFTRLPNDAYKHNDTVCKSVLICNVATAGPITGPTTVTPGSSGNAYSITPLANTTSYNWVYTPATGVTINGSGASVTINFGAGATNGVLSVNGISTICSGNTSSINISGLGADINEFDAKMLWLGQNIPNPTTVLTNIEYNLPTSGEIKFDVMNLFGQKVYSFQEKQSAAKHMIDLNVKDFSAGVYYYTLEFKGKRLVKRMVVTK
ncbi:MAG: GEVED domain-containing protein [Bacteroidota bacterium]